MARPKSESRSNAVPDLDSLEAALAQFKPRTPEQTREIEEAFTEFKNITSEETKKSDILLREKISRYLIEIEQQIDFKADVSKRLAYIDLYVLQNPGKTISGLIRELFPELAMGEAGVNPQPQLPSVRWSEREPNDTPVTFVRKHYGVWRDDRWDRNGLTKPDLRKADLQLYNALAAWESRHPDDRLDLPGQKEAVAGWVERMMSGEATPRSAAEKERLRSAQRRRVKPDGKA